MNTEDLKTDKEHIIFLLQDMINKIESGEVMATSMVVVGIKEDNTMLKGWYVAAKDNINILGALAVVKDDFLAFTKSLFKPEGNNEQ